MPKHSNSHTHPQLPACTHPPQGMWIPIPLSPECEFPYLLTPFLGESGALDLYPSSSLKPANARVWEKVPHELPEVGSLLVASLILRLLAGCRLLTQSH